MQAAGYSVDIIVTGYPGKSVCHGGLGWSSVALLRGNGRIALIDAGSFGMRGLIIKQLASRGLRPADVTDVLLTHSHYDHSVNWTLFSHARIAIGAHELKWSLRQPWGETPVPELYMRELDSWPTLHRAEDGEELLPSLHAHVAPGHTPGHLIFVLNGSKGDILFLGDAAKNRAEILSQTAEMTLDEAASAATIKMIWELWSRKPDSIVVPGHDMPMTRTSAGVEYLSKRKAAITAWFNDTLETTTLIELTTGGN